MQQLLTILILLFGTASYVVGVRAILLNTYKPSVFSRVVWLLLAAISFASIIASTHSSASLLLSGIFLAGNAAMCVVSIWKGSRSVGRLEYVCLAILFAGAVIWIVFNAPLVTLLVSLLAHFVGGVPTYKKVWQKPSSESARFWSLFFIASALTLVAGWGQPFTALVFPIYFVVFDGGMTLLSLRKRT